MRGINEHISIRITAKHVSLFVQTLTFLVIYLKSA